MPHVVNGRVTTFWQEHENDIPEPALVVTTNSDIIIIEQEDRCITVNYESLNEFIKILKQSKIDKDSL